MASVWREKVGWGGMVVLMVLVPVFVCDVAVVDDVTVVDVAVDAVDVAADDALILMSANGTRMLEQEPEDNYSLLFDS